MSLPPEAATRRRSTPESARASGGTPVDPLTGPKLALRGQIVTMDERFASLRRGVIYIENGAIVAVQEAAAPPPSGFEQTRIVDVEGTIFPGLIELHNHLAYNILRLWGVPRRFTNRGQWGGTPEYQRLVTGPMKVLGWTEQVMPSLVRYVECKCLVAGVTTSQGIELFSNAGVRRYYRGVVRNVEQTDDPDLPEAVTRIADVDARSPEKFFARLRKQTCMLLHLSEGIDATARKHFHALQLASGEWAITGALAGIHCAGLLEEDFRVHGQHQGSMVWSPMSNLLLYGGTARVNAARANGVRIALGSDWSVTGSKNLLGELKVARLAADETNAGLSDRDVVAMATREAAAILGWERVAGSIRPGARADFLVLDGTPDDPYKALLRAPEAAISLVMINGVARFGLPSLMKSLGAAGERIRVGGRERLLYLEQETADIALRQVSLATAKRTLTSALRRLPKLARDLERGRTGPAAAMARRLNRAEPPVWFLALDELEPTGLELRPRLPGDGGRATGPRLAAARPGVPLSKLVGPMSLDPLTVADDRDFLDRVAAQTVLPEFVRVRLPELY
jgi:cytosine/adenosine deaminase-related metal-dependent hydrolase